MAIAGTPRIGLGASSVTGMIEPVCSSILFSTAAEVFRNRHVPAF